MTLLLEFLKFKPQEATRVPLTAAVEPLGQTSVAATRALPQLNNQVVLGLSSQSKRRPRARLQLSKEEGPLLDLILSLRSLQQHPHLGLEAEAAANKLKK